MFENIRKYFSKSCLADEEWMLISVLCWIMSITYGSIQSQYL